MIAYLFALLFGNVMFAFILFFIFLLSQFATINIFVFGDLYELSQAIRNSNYILDYPALYVIDERIEVLDAILLYYKNHKNTFVQNNLKYAVNHTLVQLNKTHKILVGVITDDELGFCFGRRIIYRGTIQTLTGREIKRFTVCAPVFVPYPSI